jgi:hypothetical protein
VYRYFTVIRLKGNGVYIIISSRTVHVPVFVYHIWYILRSSGTPRESAGRGAKKLLPQDAKDNTFTLCCCDCTCGCAPAEQQRKQQKETRWRPMFGQFY